MVKVSLLEMFRTGKFGPIKLGMTRKRVLQLLGPPDDRGPYHKLMSPECHIWCYGDVRLHWHYDRLESLSLVTLGFYKNLFNELKHSKGFETIPQGGTKIQLDAWIIKAGLSHKEFSKALRQEGIAYSLKKNQYSHDLDTCSGVSLCFNLADDDEPGLDVISLEKPAVPKDYRVNRTARKASLLEFLRVGRLGPIVLGMTKLQIIKLLGMPDYWMAETEMLWRTSTVWGYGDCQFYWDENRLTALNFEGTFIERPYVCRRLALDTWVIRKGLPRRQFELACRHEGIKLEFVAEYSDECGYCVQATSGTYMFFDRNRGTGGGLYKVALYKRTAGERHP